MVSVVLVIITITVVAVAVYAAGRRYGGSKLVLQVTGDSMDIINGEKLPSVTIQRYVCVIMTWAYDNLATKINNKNLGIQKQPLEGVNNKDTFVSHVHCGTAKLWHSILQMSF